MLVPEDAGALNYGSILGFEMISALDKSRMQSDKQQKADSKKKQKD